MHKSWDILGLGSITVDELLYVPSFPAPDTKMQVTRSVKRIGGLTAVALLAAARLGARCAYAGVLGHDDISRYVENAMQQAGVDTSLVPYRDDAQPVHAIVIVAQETRTILFTLDGRIGADDELPPADAIRAARLLLIDDYGTKGNLRAAEIARAANIPMVADMERDDLPGYRDVLALVDHLIVPARFALRVTNAAQPDEAAKRLWHDERSAVVITCGEEGGWYVSAEQREPRQYAAFRVPAVNTLGCGDVFHGAYAAALVSGLDVHQRVQFAAAAAALKATGEGLDGLTNRAQVETLLRGKS
jgi:sugar/nucleoside kinase (ribokinase family)